MSAVEKVLAEVLHAHTCTRCRMDWTCGGISVDDEVEAERLVTMLAPVLADVWDEGAEQTAEWMANNPSPAGIPQDPPTNPYDRAGGAS